MTEQPLVERSVEARAGAEEAFRAFTHATMLRDWLSHEAFTDPRPDGYLFLRWHTGRVVTGTYTLVDAPRCVIFTWNDSSLPAGGAPAGEVQVSVEAAGSGAKITLAHRGADEGMGGFWAEALENLCSVLERGVDLRQERRPRLGIGIEKILTAAEASAMGLPMDHGLLLAGTTPASGAQRAGLLKGDVLVALNGTPLRLMEDFDVALKGLRAGDRPVVEYLRAGEPDSTPLELGAFPMPQVPETAMVLAQQLRARNAELLAAMREKLAGLSEAEASARPAEGEWSVKELAAHFILAERDYQSWTADMLNDTPVDDWLKMRTNVNPRIEALVARFGTLAALLDEFEAAQGETAGMIERFPERFARERRHLYRRAGVWALEIMHGHYFEEHLEQFEQTIAAAKEK